MLLTGPEYNNPIESMCVKCGKKFIRSPWSGAYSTYKSNLYKYYNSNSSLYCPGSAPRVVTLCDSCADEELKANNVSLLMY